jgi:dipeptidyl-peptidase 4
MKSLPLWLVIVAACARSITFAQGTAADYERAAKLSERFSGKVFRDRVEAHWLPGNTSFWYQVRTGPNTREFVSVNAVTGERRVISKAPTNAEPLRSLTPQDVPRRSSRTGDETSLTFINRTPDEVELCWISTEGERRSYGKLAPGAQREQHTFAGHIWIAADREGKTIAAFEASTSGGDALVTGTPTDHTRTAPRMPQPQRARGSSPDSKWALTVKDNNVLLRETKSGQEFTLTTDGTTNDTYRDRFYWSPDSKYLVAMRVEKGDERKVHIVESSPKDQLQPKLHSFNYLKPGDKLPHPRPVLFEVATRARFNINDELFPNPFTESGDMDIRWAPNSSRFTFRYNQRGHQVLRIIAVDVPASRTPDALAASDPTVSATLNPRAIVDERSKTFIDYSGKSFVHWLDDTDELIWMSERDGWNHLYLYDAKTGAVKNQVTRGNWVVRGVERVDSEKRQVWFRAGGIRAGQDPYHVHFCRVNFDGSSLVVLTEGDGTHNVEFSPDRRFLIDTYSRVNMGPITELRSAEDGKLICKLETADVTELKKAGWRAPEPFVAKGRDGKTDIYGVIVRPTNFEPGKKYPVIENIYAGPQSAFTPKSFSAINRMQELAELGFIVVQMDGMGTSHRSKKFHDVCWKNIGDAGFPDRIAWMKAAAKKFWEMDLTRVGIYGTSAGAQNALGGLLSHGDFYKAGVSDCGCHDNRMDKIWWNEQWMGWPVGPHYDEQSNVTLAKNLRGKLLLMVGELDRNVDPASTMQVVNALVKAKKDFDFVVVPGAGHGVAGTSYGKQRLQDFFVRSLLGKEPPQRN